MCCFIKHLFHQTLDLKLYQHKHFNQKIEVFSKMRFLKNPKLINRFTSYASDLGSHRIRHALPSEVQPYSDYFIALLRKFLDNKKEKECVCQRDRERKRHSPDHFLYNLVISLFSVLQKVRGFHLPNILVPRTRRVPLQA